MAGLKQQVLETRLTAEAQPIRMDSLTQIDQGSERACTTTETQTFKKRSRWELGFPKATGI